MSNHCVVYLKLLCTTKKNVRDFMIPQLIHMQLYLILACPLDDRAVLIVCAQKGIWKVGPFVSSQVCKLITKI